MARRAAGQEPEDGAAEGVAVEEVADGAPPSALGEFVQDLRYLLRARNPLLLVVTTEERRAETVIATAAVAEHYKVRLWDCATGAHDLAGAPVDIGGPGKPATVPAAVFDKIRAADERSLWVLRDLHDWTNDRSVVRHLKSLARELRNRTAPDRRCVIVILTASEDVPLNLRDAVTRWDLPLPRRDEVAEILDEVVQRMRRRSQITTAAWAALPAKEQREYLTIDGNPDAMLRYLETQHEVRCRFLGAGDAAELEARTSAAIEASIGLTAEAITAAMARSLVRGRTVDPAVIANEKRRMVSQVPGITWHDPDPRGLDAIGGLVLLKDELLDLRVALDPAARDFGIQAPRGILLVGPPGTGKTLVGKCAATAFRLPLLRMDLGAMKTSLHGGSENNLRRCIKTIEAVGSCVVFIDEIDQSLAGSTSEHTGDSGVAKDQLGTLLSFLQDHKGFIFLIATTNNPHRLPAELTRGGRFNGIFFCDLPNGKERQDILGVSLRALPVPRDPGNFDLVAVARATPGYSGAELAELPAVALRRAFRAHREMETGDMIQAATEMIPVSRSSPERLAEIRAWAKNRARPASEPEEPSPPMGGFGRSLDLELDPSEEEPIQ